MTTRKLCLGFGIMAAVSVLFFACATPPKPSPALAEPVKPAAPAQPAAAPAAPAKEAVAAPDALKAQATDLRKKAFDYGLKDVLPDDYAAAEASYSAGSSSYGVDNAASGKSFGDAIAKYQDLIKRGLPIVVANAKAQASKLRDTAVQKKAGDLFPDLFASAEADFSKPQSAESSGDYDSALTGYRASALEYQVLYKLCDASGARTFLVSRDLAKWDPSNWSLAEAKYGSSQGLFKQDAHASNDAVDEANLRYGVVRTTAYEYYAADRKKASETERDRAAGIKADVAVKDEYAAALALYAKAASDNDAKDYEASSAEFDSAATAFAQVYSHAKVKMDTAKGALDSFDAALSNVNAAAARNQ
jgi:hypothetical protein